MKITITKQEILNIINAAINSEKNGTTVTEFEIVEKYHSEYEVVLRQVMSEFPNLQTHKLPAIKRFRELMADKVTNGDYGRGLGLAEAKVAVEEPAQAIAYWNKYNRPINYSDCH